MKRIEKPSSIIKRKMKKYYIHPSWSINGYYLSFQNRSVVYKFIRRAWSQCQGWSARKIKKYFKINTSAR